MKFEPSYIKLYESGELDKRVKAAHGLLESCTVCPRKCKVNRLRGELGFCKIGKLPKVSSFNPHFGEERPLVGINGSGTIFFAECNLRCIYCQNYDISILGRGEEVSMDDLSSIMLSLRKLGCHNINYVTPSHVVPQILAALSMAIEGGLDIPLVYNTGGYDSVETLKLLDGVVDIYMPDIKYSDGEISKKYSHTEDYFERAKAAVKEMHRQAGDLVTDERGIAMRGLLVRHLVLPRGLAGTDRIMEFLAKEISKDTYVNIMDQYRPCGQAYKDPLLGRMIRGQEYNDAVKLARRQGLHRFDKSLLPNRHCEP